MCRRMREKEKLRQGSQWLEDSAILSLDLFLLDWQWHIQPGATKVAELEFRWENRNIDLEDISLDKTYKALSIH